MLFRLSLAKLFNKNRDFTASSGLAFGKKLTGRIGLLRSTVE